MKYYMRFTEGVDRFQQALWFVENYVSTLYRQYDIDWLKYNKNQVYMSHNIGMKVWDDDEFEWINTFLPDFFNRNGFKEVFYNADNITLGELSCTI